MTSKIPRTTYPPLPAQQTHFQRRRQRGLRLRRSLVLHALILVGLFVMLYPLFWMFASSFRPGFDIFTSNSPWPFESFTLENYINGWTGLGNETFATFFLNSFIIAGLCVLGNITACSVTAYAFARVEFPGRRTLFAIMLGTLMLPYHVQLIPQYVLFSELGWVNTFLPMVVPKFLATDAFFIFLMVQFIRGLPQGLTESARLDGCGHGGIFLRIILPLCAPAIGTTAVFTFLYSWNDFLTPMIYLTTPENYTVPLGLRLFLDLTGDTAYGSLFAMSILSLAPLVGFFIAFQRTLVQGIATTGIK